MRVRGRSGAGLYVQALLAILAAACEAEPPYKAVSLAPPQAAEATPGAAAQRPALRIAVAPVISPRESFGLYGALIEVIGRRLDRPVALLQRGTYSEINDLLRYGHAEAAFICDYAYVAGQRDFGLRLVAIPQIAGRTTYHSFLLVPHDSAARGLADLRGRSFAFSDPLSSSGWLYPTYLLALQGERPETFFKRRIFTYSHDNTVRAVAERLVDGGAVDSLVYEDMVARDPALGRRIRVIGRSPAWATPPVVVHARLDPALRESLRKIFLTLHEDAEGQGVLQPLRIDRFVPPNESGYDDVRRMARRIEERP